MSLRVHSNTYQVSQIPIFLINNYKAFITSSRISRAISSDTLKRD